MTDLTRLPDLVHDAARAGPVRTRLPVYLDLLPPCNAGCPAGENIQAWLAQIQAGQTEQAWRQLAVDNPLPAIMGRVCYHPCETACNRAQLDSSVSIHAAERFLGDQALQHGWAFGRPAGPPSGQRVLVIGAGPSGLSAAYHLARRGHQVEIRDASAEPGGMMRYGIPAYRLPRDVLAGEIGRIQALGVTITCGHRVTDLAAERAEGAFDAVFVAVGAHLSRHVDIPAHDASRIVDAVPFLREVASGGHPVLGRRVAVYGGGNTAMDAARTARRLGAEDTLIVYRRTRAQMPAHEEEAAEAEREGVRINWLHTITAFDGPELTVEVMRLDEHGFPQPTGQLETLAADTLILAVGQDADTGFLRHLRGVEFKRDGTVVVSASMMTGCPGVFAGGDMVPAERTVTVGVGHGKKAARFIDAYLRGAATADTAKPRPDVAEFGLLHPWYFADAAQRQQPQRAPAERTADFAEIVSGLDERQARYEAGRCLSCGNCIECDGCFGACPEDAIIKLGPARPAGHPDGTPFSYDVDYDRCTGCGTCYDQCPVHAIEMTGEPGLMRATIDGNEAAASVAYRLNEVCCIYPITPSSPMAELADEWSSQGRPNLWGSVPAVVEMQSEGGAAGALHGALQSGALATTFTASQGLLLMIPNMYKIAGELTPAVLHVAARSLAAQGLSIFGDHADVMAVRQTGFALLASSSVQEAHDLALVAQAASLRTRVPFVHFFDGFRTSHELNTVHLLTDDDLRALVPGELIRAHRARALSPEHPFIRGTAQNPDVYFQARETVNPFYAQVPGAVTAAMDALAARTSRQYHLAEYSGDPAAERVIVIMGSGAQTAAETARYLAGQGEKVGVVTVRLFRPFPAADLLAALPPAARRVAVLDRTKEPGSLGEPLFLDVLGALAEAHAAGALGTMPVVTGGRYGLSSKEFTPGMVASVFTDLAAAHPKPRFTIGITDDVSGTSLDYAELDIEPPGTVRAVFYGLGSDGTVGANKNTIKILGADRGLHAQGYFVYDSKKSGSQTVSHLRFGPDPIHAPYLVQNASFVGCHQAELMERTDVLCRAAPGATLLLNSPHKADEVWDSLPRPVQEQILAKGITLYAIDATQVARDAGLPGRINTVLQTCFFAISGVLPREEAITAIKAAIAKTYGRRGTDVVERNNAAVDQALAALHQIPVPGRVTTTRELPALVPAGAPDFVQRVTAEMMAGRGDALPVSALPVDGTYPSGTTAFEKRNISDLVAEWDPDLCIQCGNCSFVCPHSVIRAKFYDQSALAGAPDGFRSMPLDARGLPDTRYSLQVYAEDCTGCALCIEACPVRAPGEPGQRAINLAPREPLVEQARRDIAFFEGLPGSDRARVDFGTVRGTQYLQPLFEFSGACAGCGETPYLKLLSQLFGDRLMIANATGCSSIYGGNLPTTPWAANAAGRGPAWSNSLFEDNAEFGLGFRLAADLHLRLARDRLGQLREQIGRDLVDEILAAPQRRESELAAQRDRVIEVGRRLAGLDAVDPGVADLRSVLDHLVRRSVWLVGGDGWAYDIGSGGLDHVLASGRNVNVLVLDTEVYSNTGGQSSKATPLGAVAKFAASGKHVPKKDLALQAIAYGNVYVARVAMGADPQQTLRALREAEAYDGPSLVIAYSHCIAHGIEMRDGMGQQYRAVASGYWPLTRYDPELRAAGDNPFLLDSPRPRIPLADYTSRELRYRILARRDPAEAERLMALAAHEVQQRWATYEEMATRGAARFPATVLARGDDPPEPPARRPAGAASVSG